MQQAVTETFKSLLSQMQHSHSRAAAGCGMGWRHHPPHTFEGHTHTAVSCKAATPLHTLPVNYVINTADLSSDSRIL